MAWTVIVRCAGLIAVTTVLIVVAPLAVGPDRVQVTVIWTFWLREPVVSRQVLAKFSDVGFADFVMSHAYVWPTSAAIVFESSWGRISLTGIETSAAPMPDVLHCWFVRFVWSDEPGKRCDPSASRSYQSMTQVVPLSWLIVTCRPMDLSVPPTPGSMIVSGPEVTCAAGVRRARH